MMNSKTTVRKSMPALLKRLPPEKGLRSLFRFKQWHDYVDVREPAATDAA